MPITFGAKISNWCSCPTVTTPMGASSQSGFPSGEKLQHGLLLVKKRVEEIASNAIQLHPTKWDRESRSTVSSFNFFGTANDPLPYMCVTGTKVLSMTIQRAP